jgi:hypothetical protein
MVPAEILNSIRYSNVVPTLWASAAFNVNSFLAAQPTLHPSILHYTPPPPSPQYSLTTHFLSILSLSDHSLNSLHTVSLHPSTVSPCHKHLPSLFLSFYLPIPLFHPHSLLLPFVISLPLPPPPPTAPLFLVLPQTPYYVCLPLRFLHPIFSHPSSFLSPSNLKLCFSQPCPRRPHPLPFIFIKYSSTSSPTLQLPPFPCFLQDTLPSGIFIHMVYLSIGHKFIRKILV